MNAAVSRFLLTGSILITQVLAGLPAGAQDANDPGVLEPALSVTTGQEIRIPHSDQADGDLLLNVVDPIVVQDAEATTSLLGHPIIRASSPNDDMR